MMYIVYIYSQLFKGVTTALTSNTFWMHVEFFEVFIPNCTLQIDPDDFINNDVFMKSNSISLTIFPKW